MAALVLDIPVLAVDVELGALVLADFTPGIDGIPLPVEVTAAASCAVFIDILTAIGVGYDMIIVVSFAWSPHV